MKYISLALAALAFLSCGQPKQKAPLTAQPETSETALEKVMAGNARFASLHAVHPDESADRTREVAKAQHPMAVVIACADSRVSPELVFDEGLGDLFVIRTAGNLISDVELGSVEYAVHHLEVPLVIVMGHERCGAVQALVENQHPHGHVQCLIDSLKSEKEIQAVPLDDPNRLEDCIIANVRHQVNTLTTRSELIAEKVKKGELKVVGARYDLDDRKVTILRP